MRASSASFASSTYEVPATIYAAAVALERNPDVCAWIRESKFEPCSHGWRWAEDWKLSRDEQRERIDRAVASIQQTCGERPVGWYSRYMPSIYTRELLVEEGGFIYDSESANDDLPYYVQINGRPHLVVPYSITYNDVHYINGSYGSPTAFVDYATRALDYLLEEGKTHPRMMSVGLHCRWSGQAGRASALREFIEYAKGKEGVWFARRKDIAEWFLDRYPPSADAHRAGHADSGVTRGLAITLPEPGTIEQESAAPPPKGEAWLTRRRVESLFFDYAVVLLFGVMIVVYSVMEPSSFFTYGNFQNDRRHASCSRAACARPDGSARRR